MTSAGTILTAQKGIQIEGPEEGRKGRRHRWLLLEVCLRDGGARQAGRWRASFSLWFFLNPEENQGTLSKATANYIVCGGKTINAGTQQ